MSSVNSEEISVDVDGEFIKYTIYVDKETGFDVDPTSGQFRSRAETEEHLRSVYRVGRDTMKSDLERYNKWIRGEGKGKGDKLFARPPSGLSGSKPHRVKTAQERSAESERDAMTKEERQFAAVRCKNSGNTSLQEKNYRKAIAHYDEGIGLDPANAVLYSNKSEALIRLRRFATALGVARTAVSIDTAGAHQEKAHFRIATCLVEMGRGREALALCDDALGGKLHFRAASAALWEEKRALIQALPTCKWAADDIGGFKLRAQDDFAAGAVLREEPAFLTTRGAEASPHFALTDKLVKKHLGTDGSNVDAVAKKGTAQFLAVFLGKRLDAAGTAVPGDEIAAALGRFFSETSLPAAFVTNQHLQFSDLAAGIAAELQAALPKSADSSLPASLTEELLCILLLLQRESVFNAAGASGILTWFLGLRYVAADPNTTKATSNNGTDAEVAKNCKLVLSCGGNVAQFVATRDIHSGCDIRCECESILTTLALTHSRSDPENVVNQSLLYGCT